MYSRIDHLVITTAHLEKCLAFYKALGFTVKKAGNRHELLGEGFKINVHTLGEELDPHAANPAPGSSDFCVITIKDLDELLQIARENNLEIVYERNPRTGFYGKMESIYLRDPDGNLVEISAYAE
jgi:catechol 2,3-dioxygenase-like lactoylglutathione lyase family enzyme